MNFLAVSLPRPRPVKWALWLALASSLAGALSFFLFLPDVLTGALKGSITAMGTMAQFTRVLT